MAVNSRLLALLAKSRIEYELMPHREAFTAQEVAQTAHIRGRRLAKVVLVRSGRSDYLMAVVPASAHVDLELLSRISGHKHLELATEGEIQRVFADCELGAMPPFGNLFGLPVYVDSKVAGEEIIAYNAGSHRDVVLMRFKDFQNLVKPEVVHFARMAAA